MKKHPSLRFVAYVFVAVLCLSMAGRVTAQPDLESLVHQALDQKITLEVKDKPLSSAFLKVAEQTGVSVTIKPSVLALLPYGADTRMNARIVDTPLRVGIERLLTPLGLTYRVEGGGLEVIPTEPLRRIVGRATWDELETIAWLRRTEFTGDDVQKEELSRRLRFEDYNKLPEPLLRLFQAMQDSGAGTLDEVLTAALGEGRPWYPSGKRIVVTGVLQQSQRELKRRVTLTASHKPLFDILTDLSNQAGIRIIYGPDALVSLPIRAQKDFSIVLKNATVEQALEEIKAATGLTYQLYVGGVIINRGSRRKAESRERVGAVLVIPGRGEIPIYESDMSPETRKALDELIDRLMRAIPDESEESPDADQ